MVKIVVYDDAVQFFYGLDAVCMMEYVATHYFNLLFSFGRVCRYRFSQFISMIDLGKLQNFYVLPPKYQSTV